MGSKEYTKELKNIEDLILHYKERLKCLRKHNVDGRGISLLEEFIQVLNGIKEDYSHD